MKEKLQLIGEIFGKVNGETAVSDLPHEFPVPIQHGKFYGGVYNGRKYMYSAQMIETLPIEKLEKVIKTQIGYQEP